MFCQTCNEPMYNEPTCSCYRDEIKNFSKYIKLQKIKNVYFDLDSELKDVLVITTNKKKFYIGIQCSIYRDQVYPSISLNDYKLLAKEQPEPLTNKDYGTNYISLSYPSHKVQSKQINKAFQESCNNIKLIIGASIRRLVVKKDKLYRDALVIHTKRHKYYITIRATTTLTKGTYCPISTNHSKLCKTPKMITAV